MADLTWLIASGEILALTIPIGILAIWKTLRDKKSGFPLADERTQKLNWKAAYYAMFMCQYLIIAYLVVSIVGTEFFGMPEIEAGYPMIAALLVSSVSFLVLRYGVLAEKGNSDDDANQNKRIKGKIRPHPRRSRKKGGSEKRNHPLHRKMKLQPIPQASARYSKSPTDHN